MRRSRDVERDGDVMCVRVRVPYTPAHWASICERWTVLVWPGPGWNRTP